MRIVPANSKPFFLQCQSVG